jgi:hypothetical protein
MDRRSEVRKQQILAEYVVDRRVINGMLKRLSPLPPFAVPLPACRRRLRRQRHITCRPTSKNAEEEKGVRSNLPERPEGCFAQIGPDPFFPAAQDSA